MKRIVFACLGIFTQICIAQTNSQIVGAAYDAPRQNVAPGQVITFWISGAKTVFPTGQQIRTADTVPLPTILAGFSVSFQQDPIKALLPIFSVRQVNDCPDKGARPSCISTGITVQLPIEMQACGIGPTRCEVDRPPVASIEIIENGTRSDSFELAPQPDSIHILTDCDSISLHNSCSFPKITHADGTLFSTNPIVEVGESLVMYAVGLGVTDPRVPAGTITPGPAPLVQKPYILYSYFLDPSDPAGPGASTPVAPVITYAGLAPGEVGIYQVNFVVPTPPPDAMSCNFGTFNPRLRSNLTVNLVGLSFDSVNLCVKLPSKDPSGDGSSHAAVSEPLRFGLQAAGIVQ